MRAVLRHKHGNVEEDQGIAMRAPGQGALFLITLP